MDSTAQRRSQLKKQAARQKTRPELGLPWKIQAQTTLAQIVLFWENFWKASWLFWGTLGAVTTLILLDLLAQFPIWGHITFLVLSGILIIYGGIKALVGTKFPTRYEALRRLEQDNHLSHRPLSSLDDRPIKVSKDGLGLWLNNKKRLAASFSSLKLTRPSPQLFKLDPYGLRALIIVGLFIATFSLHQWPDRLASAFELKKLTSITDQQGTTFSLWLTPPDYTGISPLFYDQSFAPPEEINLPRGSKVIAQFHGEETAPDIQLDARAFPTEQTGKLNHQSEFTIQQSGTLQIGGAFTTLLSTKINLIEDSPPKIFLTEQPQGNDLGLLRINYEAHDDYGTNLLTIEFWPTDSTGKTESTEKTQIEVPLPASKVAAYKGQHYLDLTDNILAGEEVWFQLSVRDVIGQRSQTDTIKITIPERDFTHPLAQQLVQLRKDLNIPGNKLDVIATLGLLVKEPATYNHDSLVALTMSIAGKHLLFDHTPLAVKESQNILWKTALHLEDGRISTAQRELRNIQQQLRDALSSNADQNEISRLMDQLQQAVDQLLTNMLEDFLNNADKKNPAQSSENAQTIESKDLQNMIEQARMLAENGSMEEAMEMLSQLQNMLENLAFQQGQQPGNNANDVGRETFEKLQELTKRQEELLENSYKRQQEAQKQQEGNGAKPSPQTMPGDGRPGEQAREQRDERYRDAKSQERIRQELEQMMENIQELLGNLPEDFDQAEQSMGIARDALRGQDGEGKENEQAVRAQTRSLRKLQNGTEQAAEKYLKMLSQAPERGSGWVRGKDGSGRDPFGRNIGNKGGSIAKQGVPLPNETDVMRSRSILEELRNRRNDRQRSKEERTYIQKLLERF
ncbi:TIGR02302 family protein [Kiloniella sp. EL199]|uniref:TIGR02302 family protein n=1 Tax=Kiloniella sp. EL199 TaxID=2107581 RepID=UPI000EA19491|nr:TIGR02302 family protein [Kiloniella sp. EL199]